MSAASPETDRPPPPPDSDAPLKLLVVEDSEDDFELLVAHLRRHGRRLQARRVEDEPGLRSALGDDTWDVVASDFNLPCFDCATAQRIAGELQPFLPFIIVSGHIGEDAAVEAMHAGADDYVMKHNLARLLPAIDRSLASRDQRRMRMESDAALRDAHERMRALVSASPLAIIQLDAQGLVQTWNHAAEAMFGWTEEEVRGCPSPHVGESATQQNLQIRRDTLNGITFANRPGQRVTKDGRVLDVLISAARVVTPDGRYAGAVTMLADVTAQRRTEAELRDLSVQMESRLEEERAGIARELHDEVGGTLVAVKADIDWLRRHASGEPGARAKVDDMERMVGNVLASSTRLARALRPGSLDDTIVAAVGFKSAEFAERMGMPCRFRANDEEISLPADRSNALIRVFQEALTNITTHAGATEVDVELFATPAEVTLEIRDNGRGLRAGDDAKPGSFGIRGMRERLNALGGWIDVSGEPARGTTVMVSMPRAPEKAAP